MITPIEIQNKEFRRTFRGYNEEEVDEFLKIITDDFNYTTNSGVLFYAHLNSYNI